MTPLYIITARGGSKGIPGKNIKPLGGLPLIHYTIFAAQAAAERRGGTVLLSTDSEEIARTAREAGLAVPYMRPSELAGDTTSSRDVVLHAMAWAEARGLRFDCVVLLQPTSPFRTADDIVAALDMWSPHIDMVVSVVPSDANPYYNLFETDSDGMLHVCKGDGLFTRRQDAPKIWEYNGAVYVITPDSIKAMPMGVFPRRVPYVMPAERSIDLDTLADWQRAEQIIKDRNS